MPSQKPEGSPTHNQDSWSNLDVPVFTKPLTTEDADYAQFLDLNTTFEESCEPFFPDWPQLRSPSPIDPTAPKDIRVNVNTGFIDGTLIDLTAPEFHDMFNNPPPQPEQLPQTQLPELPANLADLDGFDDAFWFNYQSDLELPDSPLRENVGFVGNGTVHPLLGGDAGIPQNSRPMSPIGNPFADDDAAATFAQTKTMAPMAAPMDNPFADNAFPTTQSPLLQDIPALQHSKPISPPTAANNLVDWELPELNFTYQPVVDGNDEYPLNMNIKPTLVPKEEKLTRDELMAQLPRLHIPQASGESMHRVDDILEALPPPPMITHRYVPPSELRNAPPATHLETGFRVPPRNFRSGTVWYQARRGDDVIGYVPRHEQAVPSRLGAQPVVHPPANIPIQQVRQPPVQGIDTRGLYLLPGPMPMLIRRPVFVKRAPPQQPTLHAMPALKRVRVQQPNPNPNLNTNPLVLNSRAMAPPPLPPRQFYPQARPQFPLGSHGIPAPLSRSF